MKNRFVILSFCVATLSASCKKDQLEVKEEKTFVQADYVPSNNYDGGWQLTLNPGKIADVLPSGDIVFRGTYNISGDKIKVKTDEDTFEFKIISNNELKEVKYGTILRLKIN